ncbi:MAG: hypothetical protein WCF94_01310 [bacterium]
MFKDLDKNLMAGILGLMSVFVFSVALNQYMTLRADFSSAPGTDMAAVVAAAPAPVTPALNSCETVEYLYSLGYIPAESVQKSRDVFNCAANTTEIKVLGVKDSIVAAGTVSMLVGDLTLSVKTNSSVADVQSLIFGKNLPWRLVKSTASTTPIYVNGMTMSIYSVSGVKDSNSIPKAGTYTVVFRVGFPANNLFAGSYRYEYNPQGSVVTATNKVILGNYVTVIGEKGPYITSVSPLSVKPGEKITLNGVRLKPYTAIYANGAVINPTNIVSTETGLSFDAPTNWTSGYYNMQISNAYGMSNYSGSVGVTVMKMDYIESQTGERNIIHPGEVVTIYGDNLNLVNRVFVNGTITGVDASFYAGQVKSLKFVTPNVPAGEYDVYIYNAYSSWGERVAVKIIDKIATPSITVTSPNGGETFANTDTINLSFTGVGIASTITAYLYSPTLGNVYKVTRSVPVDTNSGVVSTGFLFDLSKSTTAISAGQYKINVCDNSQSPVGAPGKSLCDMSDNYFTIASSTITTPYIKVTSPNGGETWTIDSPVKITWNSNMTASTTKVFLVNESGASCSVGSAMPGISEYGFRLSSGAGNDCNFTAGKYKAYVKTMGVADYSDNYFTVSEPAVVSDANTSSDLASVNNITTSEQSLASVYVSDSVVLKLLDALLGR